jgi:hypothetical protein
MNKSFEGLNQISKNENTSIHQHTNMTSIMIFCTLKNNNTPTHSLHKPCDNKGWQQSRTPILLQKKKSL